DAEAVGGQFALDLIAKGGVEIHDVLAVGPAQLEVRDAIEPAAPDLLVQVRPDLVGKSGEFQHGGMVGIPCGAVKGNLTTISTRSRMPFAWPEALSLAGEAVASR